MEIYEKLWMECEEGGGRIGAALVSKWWTKFIKCCIAQMDWFCLIVCLLCYYEIMMWKWKFDDQMEVEMVMGWIET